MLVENFMSCVCVVGVVVDGVVLVVVVGMLFVVVVVFVFDVLLVVVGVVCVVFGKNIDGCLWFCC